MGRSGNIGVKEIERLIQKLEKRFWRIKTNWTAVWWVFRFADLSGGIPDGIPGHRIYGGTDRQSQWLEMDRPLAGPQAKVRTRF
jgi:hypothetical protein